MRRQTSIRSGTQISASEVLMEMVDFSEIIRRLEARGLTVYKIALACGARHNQVDAWKRGNDPRYHFGVRLIELYAAHVASVPPV